MTTIVRYNDSYFKSKCHRFEAGLRIIHYTCDSPYHGATETTWVVRDPVSGKELAVRDSEDKARQAAREMAEEKVAA
ncbi:MAG: hypothetical protein ACR2OE_14960 [Thermomicrobiales bacterium]